MSDRSDSPYVAALRFRWLTPAYDAVVRATTRERTFKHALIDQAQLRPGQRVLDVACGTGTMALWIKQRYPNVSVTGLDGDPQILKLAARKATRQGVSIRLDQGMSFDMPYADASFDCAFSSLFFHHLSWRDKVRTADELYRVLRDGGELHVADWGRPSGRIMRTAFFAIQLLDGFQNTRDNVEGKLIDVFRHAGFTEVTQRRAFPTVFGTLALYRAVKPSR